MPVEHVTTAPRRITPPADPDQPILVREHEARTRDRVADRDDRETERLTRRLTEETASDPGSLPRAFAALARQAGSDRRRAAADRHSAARDRSKARAERRRSEGELARASLDALTGVYGRLLGEDVLASEVDRAQRMGHPLTLAFLDVDGLKAVNDRDGHHAGDDLLRSVAEAIRAGIRSYDPVVRFGGDEFLCAFPDTGYGAARRRVDEIQSALAERRPGHSISAGLAELREGESLDELVARSDAALLRAKRARGRGRPA